MIPKDPFIQFQLIEGSALEEGPLIGVYPDKAANGSSAKGSGPLYLFLEPSIPAGLPACYSAQEMASRLLRSSKGSLTGRLRDYLKSLHEHIARENLGALPQNRFSLGAVCATVRGNDLYVAQSGPPAVYVINESGAKRVAPPSDLNLSPEAMAALGASRELPARLYRHALTPGSVVLIASSSLEESLSLDDIFDYFRDGMDEGLINIYKKMAGRKYFGVLVFAPTVGELDESLDIEPVGTPPRAEPQPGPQLRIPADHIGARVRSEARKEAQKLKIKLRPQPRFSSNYGLMPFSGLAVLKMTVLAAFMMVGLWLMWQEVSGRDDAKFASLVAEAEVLQHKASQATSRDQNRELLAESKLTLEAALNLKKENTSVRGMLESVKERISQLDTILVLEEPRLLADFQSLGTAAPLIRDISVGNGKVYLLDKARDQVYQVALSPIPVEQGSGEPPVTLRSAQNTYKNLAHLFWMPRGPLWTRDSLLALDDRRRLLEYTAAGDVRELPIRGADEWGGAQSAVGYGGNLYILDTLKSQVWRYVPTDRGFDTERKGLLSGVELKGAVDMAVDGDIYIIMRTGELVKFVDGRPAILSIDGLDKPLSNPSAIFGTSQTKFLYIVDRGNSRIVVIDKNGALRYQLALPNVTNLQDVYLDEGSSTIYLATDSKLYLSTMPTSGGTP
ncbi:MAG: hypothetical protein EXR50_04890 [Dehalococcoidia bacterium]|nr:hypothetical protein [Dehalococcoidia bacterium]